MGFDIEVTRNIILKQYNRAKSKLTMRKALFSEDSKPISDVIPGYDAKHMEFADYIRDNFTPLFVDIRDSTKRAMEIGPENTFLSMHAFFPGVCNVVEQHGGYIVDFMGDGIMALFGGKISDMPKAYTCQKAGICGLGILNVVNNIINPLLDNDKIWKLSCGVGIDYGPVIVTKIGTSNSYDVKAFGSCINSASELSKYDNKVVVSKTVRKEWPSSPGGKMRFKNLQFGNVCAYELIRST